MKKYKKTSEAKNFIRKTTRKNYKNRNKNLGDLCVKIKSGINPMVSSTTTIDIYATIYNHPLYQKYKYVYQQFQMTSMVLSLYPEQFNGYKPTIMSTYLTYKPNNEGTLLNTELSYLPSSRNFVAGDKKCKVRYTNSGRQEDFKYWYSSQLEFNPGLYLRMKQTLSNNNPSTWYYQVTYYMKFRHVTCEYEDTKSLEVPLQNLNEDKNKLRDLDVRYGGQMLVSNPPPSDIEQDSEKF
jgi:hypothetical protein